MTSNIPISCGKCKFGHTFDLSVDDLCTYCTVLNTSQDWCDFPNRKDDSLRMHGCPLPDLTKEQIESAERRVEEIKYSIQDIHHASSVIFKQYDKVFRKLSK